VGIVYPGVISVPSLMIAGTDTKHYLHLSKNIYRFSPLVLEKEDIDRIHGVNERIHVQSFERYCDFFLVLLQRVAFREA
jgi:carboxypeptidase PM20D1